MIPLGVRQEERHAQPRDLSAKACYPGIGLRLDPVGSDRIGKGLAADGEFRSEDPFGTLPRGADDSSLDRATVRDEITRRGGKVQKGYAEGWADHVLCYIAGASYDGVVGGTIRNLTSSTWVSADVRSPAKRPQR